MRLSNRKEADMEKKITEYEAPSIQDHGDLAELTAGTHTGEFTDAEFPVNTPKGQLTFTTP
jgi:hypothetical protein